MDVLAIHRYSICDMNHSCISNDNSLFISSFAYVFVLEEVEIAMTFMFSKTKEIFNLHYYL